MAFTGKYEFNVRVGLCSCKSIHGISFIAEGTDPDGNTIITQGHTKEELMDNVADAFLTSGEVSLSWWNRLMKKLILY